MKEKSPEWKKFEQEVASLYRDLGAREVTTDIDVAGNQIDVFAVVPRIDGTFSRDIISCKCYKKKAGVGDIREWNEVFVACKSAQQADNAVVVTNQGFTNQAQVLAKSIGIHTRTIDQLKWASVDLVPYLLEFQHRLKAEPTFKNEVYVPLRFIEEGTDAKLNEAELLEWFFDKDDCSLLAILGDYGAGKTTLSKHLFLMQSDRYLKDEREIVPIYLNLHDYAGVLNIQGLIMDVLVQQHSARCPNFAKIRKLIEEGRVLLIFDAFDEMISKSNYDETLANFREIISVLTEHSKAILTCRTHYFKDSGELRGAYRGTELFQVARRNDFPIINVQPFTEDEIEEVLRRQFRDNADAAIQKVRSTYDLMGLAKRPILLTMITAVIDELLGESEINNAKLYNTYVNQWLARDDWRVKLNTHLRREFTITLALDMYLSGNHSFAWDKIASSVANHFTNASTDDLTAYDNDIRVCSFIRRNKNDEFEFVHQSFLEYFVARQLYRDIVADDNERLATHAYSKEILSFLSQQTRTTEIENNITRWLANTDENSTLAKNLMGITSFFGKVISGKIHSLSLQEVVISKTNVIECELLSTKVETIQWTCAEWRDVRSTKGIWGNAKFNVTALRKCYFFSDNFEGCTFDLTTLEATWEASRFNATTIVCHNAKARFASTDFYESDLSKMKGAIRFISCDFESCHIPQCIELSGGTVRDSTIENLDLRKTSLDGACFEGGAVKTTSFSVTSLKNVRFSGTEFCDCDWSADNKKSNRCEAVFENVKGLTSNEKTVLKSMGVKFVQSKEGDT